MQKSCKSRCFEAFERSQWGLFWHLTNRSRAKRLHKGFIYNIWTKHLTSCWVRVDPAGIASIFFLCPFFKCKCFKTFATPTSTPKFQLWVLKNFPKACNSPSRMKAGGVQLIQHLLCIVCIELQKVGFELYFTLHPPFLFDWYVRAWMCKACVADVGTKAGVDPADILSVFWAPPSQNTFNYTLFGWMLPKSTCICNVIKSPLFQKGLN